MLWWQRPNCKQGPKAEVHFYQKSEGRRGRSKDLHLGSKIWFPWVSKGEMALESQCHAVETRATGDLTFILCFPVSKNLPSTTESLICVHSRVATAIMHSCPCQLVSAQSVYVILSSLMPGVSRPRPYLVDNFFTSTTSVGASHSQIKKNAPYHQTTTLPFLSFTGTAMSTIVMGGTHIYPSLVSLQVQSPS